MCCPVPSYKNAETAYRAVPTCSSCSNRSSAFGCRHVLGLFSVAQGIPWRLQMALFNQPLPIASLQCLDWFVPTGNGSHIHLMWLFVSLHRLSPCFSASLAACVHDSAIDCLALIVVPPLQSRPLLTNGVSLSLRPVQRQATRLKKHLRYWPKKSNSGEAAYLRHPCLSGCAPSILALPLCSDGQKSMFRRTTTLFVEFCDSLSLLCGMAAPASCH